MDDIDPSSGYNYSPAAYDSCRRSWVSNIAVHGFSGIYDGPGLTRALANWTEHRPEFTAGDDWFADAEKAHLAYWERIGLPCNRSSCDIHNANLPAA